MIVYRVVSAKDILSGRPGEAIPTYKMADEKAQELANETGKEVSLISFNTYTRGMERVDTYYPNAYAQKAKQQKDEAARRSKESAERVARMREENLEHLRRMRDGFARAQQQYQSRQQSATPQKTKLSVAMANLELSEGFDQPTLKTQHRKMVMKYHPDKTGGDSKNFQYVQKSYEYILEVKGWK